MSFDSTRETDVSVLRQAVQLLERENRTLLARVAELTKALAKARGNDEIQALQLELGKLETQLSKRNQMLFGSSSEKRPTGKNKNKRPRDQGPRPEDRHTGGARRPQPQLPVESVVHDLDLADQACKSCGGALTLWEGKLEESKQIDCVTRRFVVKKHQRKVYRCTCGACIEAAPGPLKLRKGARYSIDFAIEVVIGKYRDHLPLERQVRAMKHEGLVVDSQTLFDQCHHIGELLTPAYDGIGTLLRSQSVLGADETRWPVYGSKGTSPKPSRWHAWIVASDEAVYFEIHDSRRTDAALAVIGSFRGVLVVDGYSAYRSCANQLEGLLLANCWAHVRRGFFDIQNAFPSDTERILHLIGLLYRIEARASRGRQHDARRLSLRNKRSRVVMMAIQVWVHSVSTTAATSLAKAIDYMSTRWTALSRFLDNPTIPLDNNGSERGVRGLVLGRKNHTRSRYRRGSEVAAKLYTLIETCKLLDLNPQRYLRVAIEAALNEQPVPLPHEVLAQTLS